MSSLSNINSLLAATSIIAAGGVVVLFAKVQSLQSDVAKLTAALNVPKQIAAPASADAAKPAGEKKDAGAASIPKALVPKPPRASLTTLLEPLLPNNCTEVKIAFGGDIMAWCARPRAACAELA